VLRPGARAAVLDFNRIDLNESDLSGIDAAGSPGREALLAFQRFYLRRIVVPVARAVDLEEHYAYLEASLRRFPTGQEQEQLALGAGFAWVQHRPLAAGLMGLLLLVA
jgi:demethylmenaquinone methyltransferase/2-methoxy-6-polyprenyl-1,4-benzoquinol methylase